jgi:hypothetical protein
MATLDFVNPIEIRQSVLVDYVSPAMDFVPDEQEPGS